MRKFSILIALSLVAVSKIALAQPALAPAPSREETFKQIGRSLEGIGSTLNSSSGRPNGPADWNVLAKATGSTLTTTATVTGLAGPNPTANATATLVPGTKVQFQGVENGFVKIAPLEGLDSGKSLWVPQGTAKATFISDYVDDRIADAMNQVSRFATAIENNPYVRLKGFKISVSLSPSLDVEFEMKGGGNASAASPPMQSVP